MPPTAPENASLAPDAARLALRNAWIPFVLTMSTLEALQNSTFLPELGWPLLFIMELPVWAVWMALCLPIFAISRRFPLGGPQNRRNLLVHVFASLVTPIVLLTVVNGLRYLMSVGFFALHVPLNKAQHEYLALGVNFLWLLPRTIVRYYAFPVILYFGVVGIYHALAYYHAYNARRLHQSELETLLAQSQLETLRLQLQPHFLFNSLNTVSSLMKRDPDSARRVLSDLSELLRYALNDRSEHVSSLRDDLAFLQGYVAIQKARFRDELEVSLDIDERTCDMLVPRMLLQPLVENSIKHAVSPRKTTHVQIRSLLSGKDVVLLVTDDGPGFKSDCHGGDGIGLRNTRQRIDALYGADASFTTRNRREGGAEVCITIPAERMKARGHGTPENTIAVA